MRNPQQFFRRRQMTFWAVAVLAVGALSWSLFAQDAMPALGRVKNFFVPDYYPPPNQNQMKSLLRGAEAEPQADRSVLIKDLSVETYRPDGTVELTIHSPECSYNPAEQSATSASHIEARSGDGRMLVEGEGYFWQNADSTFVISNRVHTIVQAPLDKPKQP